MVWPHSTAAQREGLSNGRRRQLRPLCPAATVRTEVTFEVTTWYQSPVQEGPRRWTAGMAQTGAAVFQREASSIVALLTAVCNPRDGQTACVAQAGSLLQVGSPPARCGADMHG